MFVAGNSKIKAVVLAFRSKALDVDFAYAIYSMHDKLN